MSAPQSVCAAALPGAPFLAREGDDLWLDGVRLADVAAEFGTPLYVYSRSAMTAAAAAYQQALAGRPHLLCYAMKANSSLAVIKTFADLGLGFDIVSGGELARVIAVGGDPAKVVFSGVGKTRAEMRDALRAGVKCFNVESEGELDGLSEVAAGLGLTAAVSLRVNPDVDAKTHPYISTGLKGNKFGVAHGQALAFYQRAATLPGIRVTGIDCHIGSQITEISPSLDALDRLLALIEQVEARGIAIQHIDLGGGLGITYTDEQPPAADLLVSQLLARIDARAAAAFGLWNFVAKLSLAVAAATVLPALDLAGFRPGEENSAFALNTLTLIYAAVPCVLKIAAIVLLAFTSIPEPEKR